MRSSSESSSRTFQMAVHFTHASVVFLTTFFFFLNIQWHSNFLGLVLSATLTFMVLVIWISFSFFPWSFFFLRNGRILIVCIIVDRFGWKAALWRWNQFHVNLKVNWFSWETFGIAVGCWLFDAEDSILVRFMHDDTPFHCQSTIFFFLTLSNEFYFLHTLCYQAYITRNNVMLSIVKFPSLC